MLNIVVPMAGAGSRFIDAGFNDPKPLICINKTPMIKVVIDNLKPNQPHQFIFICQKKHIELYGLNSKLSSWALNSKLIEIDGMTEGAACTVLAAKQIINNNIPLMIANSDQFIDLPIDVYLQRIEELNLDGLIMTMTANDPKWSYVKLDNLGFVTNVVEKKVISSEATVGIYNFKRGSDFVIAAEKMIINNERSNNEFYVAPVYNNLISKPSKIGIFNIGKEGDGMHGLGTPRDLDLFIQNKSSRFLFCD
jgi:dTDP-glucose pyrophosphorylase